MGFVNLHLKLALVLLEQVSQVNRVWDALLKIFWEKAAKKIIKIDVNECILQKNMILNLFLESCIHFLGPFDKSGHKIHCGAELIFFFVFDKRENLQSNPNFRSVLSLKNV